MLFDRTFSRDAAGVLYGAPSVVTPAGGAAVETDVIWRMEPVTPANMALGASAASAVEQRQTARVRRDEVPVLPIGSSMTGQPERPQKVWRVVTVDDSHPDYLKAVVS